MLHEFISEMILFLAMGGYARYVWPAYFLAFGLLFFNIYWPLRQYRIFLQKISQSAVAEE